MRKQLAFLLLIVQLVLVSVVMAQDTPEQADGVAVTVYNEGTALVKDTRTMVFTEGLNQINFTDVAANIDQTSVNFQSLTNSVGTFILEQNYQYDLVNSSALLSRYVDERIEVTMNDGTTFAGQLLSGRGGEIILQTDTGQVMVVQVANARNINFPALPDGLITRPTLQWLISSSQAGSQQVELTYLTGGMSWNADYNVLLGADNASLDLNGWVTINNNSGTTFDNALLKLVAGDVNRVADPNILRNQAIPADYDGGLAFEEEVAQREFFEYQLYQIPRRVTLNNNETKQIEFVTGAGVPANRFFVYDGSPFFGGYYDIIADRSYWSSGVSDVQTWLEFTTDDDGGLGADLPAGRIRVYQEDVDGAALLIGENFIDHTPQGEDVQIYLGNAFDLVGERTQTNYELVTGRIIEESFEIRIRNRKDTESVEVRIPERLFRWSNWQILNSSHAFEQLDSATIEYRVNVPAGEEVVVSYTVRYEWPR